MERRKAIATLLSLGLAAETNRKVAKAEEPEIIEVSEKTSLIPFARLEALPDSPLEAAQKLILQRPPIYYPEYLLKSAIQTEVEARIQDIAYRYGEDPNKLKRIAWCESRYLPNSVNLGYGVRSTKGIDYPTGTWQYLLGTFTRFLRMDVDYRRDLDVETLLFVHSYRLSPGEWTCR